MALAELGSLSVASMVSRRAGQAYRARPTRPGLGDRGA